MSLQFLADVMRAGAGSKHDRRPATPFLAARESTGVENLAGKILQRLDCGNVGGAADAGREHDVPGSKGTGGAVSSSDMCRPSLFGLIVFGVVECRSGPEIDLHDVDVALEPVRDFVLRDVIRKGRRKWQVTEMIDRRLVVELEAAVAQPPIVADAPGFIDDQRIEADAFQFDRRRNTGMAATDDENVGLAIVERDLGLPLVEPVATCEITRMRDRRDVP